MPVCVLTTMVPNTYLSAKDPNRIFPTKMPNMNVVCAQSANCPRAHTKSHSDLIVWVKIDWLNLWLGHVVPHFSIVLLLHSNSTFGAMKMMLIWCQATGNFNRKTTAQTRKCHLPKAPMAFCSTSTGPALLWLASTSSTSAIKDKKWLILILIVGIK